MQQGPQPKGCGFCFARHLDAPKRSPPRRWWRLIKLRLHTLKYSAKTFWLMF